MTLTFASPVIGQPPPDTAQGPAIQLASAQPQGRAALAKPDQAIGQATEADGLDAEAVAALKRMSDYLSTLNSFELISDATLDVVTGNEQRLQLDGQVHYKVKRPGIRMELTSDLKSRSYYYDGKQFTVFAPKLGYYATMPAPATNREFLRNLDEKFGIELPLEDLFRWSDGDDSDIAALTSGFNVGTATIDGVKTDHWAFRQPDYDWEVWIEQGARPLPRKLTIIKRTDPALPGYTARLRWTPNAAFADEDFTFKPGPGATQIQLATLVEEAK
jgi:hypothetical protein